MGNAEKCRVDHGAVSGQMHVLRSAVNVTAQVIRGLLGEKTYVIVVEHDLAVLDYLSDFICCLYGKPGAYGVVTLPFSVREGINIFLAGFVPTENLRFREEALTFKVRTSPEQTCSAQRSNSGIRATLAEARGEQCSLRVGTLWWSIV